MAAGSIFAAAQILEFRGVLLPCTDWEHRFAHEKAQHHIIYRDGVAVDQLGGQGRTFSYVLMFDEGIIKSPFLHAFTKLYWDFYRAYSNKDAGDLIDPIHGPIWAVPGEWNGNADISSQSGVKVRVTFTEDKPVDGTNTDTVPTFAGLLQASGSLDTEAATVAWKRPEDIPTLKDPLTAARGVVDQVNRAKGRGKSTFLSVADKANQLEVAADDLGSDGGPKANAVRNAARTLRLQALQAAENPPQHLAVQVQEITLKTPRLIASLAADSGMDIAQFLQMNPGCARGGAVPAGTTIRTIKGKRRTR